VTRCRWKVIVFSAGVMLIAVCAALRFACILAPSRRIPREHGVSLPGSARHMQCVGTGWLHAVLPDAWAGALFVMDAHEWGGWQDQLNVHRTNSPSQPRVGVPNPWWRDERVLAPFERVWTSELAPLHELNCWSSTGEALDVRVWEISGTQLVANLHTRWY